MHPSATATATAMSEITPTNPLTVINPFVFDIRLSLPDVLVSLDRVSSSIASDVDAPNSAARSAPDALTRGNVIESLIHVQSHARASSQRRVSPSETTKSKGVTARRSLTESFALEAPTSSTAARATPRPIPTLTRTTLSRSLAFVDDDAVAHATRALARASRGVAPASTTDPCAWFGRSCRFLSLHYERILAFRAF
jgi:hypothetical protein